MSFTAEVGNLPPSSRTWPAKAFYPARDLLLSFDPRPFFSSMKDMQQYTAEMIFTLLWPKKGLNFWRKPFYFGSLDWWRLAGTLLGTKCGPLVQKVADLYFKSLIWL